MTDAINAWRLVCWIQRLVILALVGVLLLGCASLPLDPRGAPGGALTYEQVDACLARHFGVPPLEVRPRIEYTSLEALNEFFDKERQFYGHDARIGGVALTPLAGGPAAARIIIAHGTSVEGHDRILTHEVIHLYQHYRLGMGLAKQPIKETHAARYERVCMRG